MLPETIFPAIPAMYPISMAIINTQLLPFVDLDVMLL